MKNLKLVFTILTICLLTSLTYAQHHRPHHRMKTPGIEEFKADLNLTETQEAEIEKIREKYKAERENLKQEATGRSPENRKKMHELMKAQGEEIRQVLTEEQQKILDQKLEERHQQHFEKRKARSGEMKEMHEALKTYRDENIHPVLLQQRAKLEEKITVADKAEIDALRPVFKDMHENGMRRHRERMDADEPLSKDERQALHEEHRQKMEEMKPKMEALQALVQKYEEDMDELLAEVSDQREQWKEDMKKIHEQYKENDGDHRMRRGHPHRGDRPKGPEGWERPGKRMDREKGEMRKGHFLLLDPNEATGSAGGQKVLTTATISPNPAVNSNTLTYTLATDNPVRIELRNEQGGVIDVLFDGEKTAGMHSLSVDLTNRKSGAYYITILSGKEVVSKKFIVAK